jgi:hypothetical protein
MRATPNSLVERYRTTDGPLASDTSYGNNGAFAVPGLQSGTLFSVIASDGDGWEHVSVVVVMRRGTRVPTWAEMCHIKALFWTEDEAVLQYHPAKADYVNIHPHVLHLWRPIGVTVLTPPVYMV